MAHELPVPPMTQILSIEMLGGLRIRVRASTITRFRTQKTAALLGYLAFYPQRVHSREELVDLFWPDSDIDAGRGSLRASLASLRVQFEQEGIDANDVLEADRKVVRLNTASVETDVARFELTAAAASRIQNPSDRAEELTAAVDLYRGPLMSGHYDDWIMQERDRIQQVYASLLRNAAASHQEIGDLSKAIQFLQRLVALEPLTEEAYADLMRLFAASGNLSA